MRSYVLWICDRCGDHAEVEPGGICEVCLEGTVQVVDVVPASGVEPLREVERAARVYFREFDHLIGGEYPERSDLRDALASTPAGGSDADA